MQITAEKNAIKQKVVFIMSGLKAYIISQHNKQYTPRLLIKSVIYPFNTSVLIFIDNSPHSKFTVPNGIIFVFL